MLSKLQSILFMNCMNMEEKEHLDNLKDLYRLCRIEAASIKGYKDVKFATEFSGQIQSLFGYDLNDEIDGVHHLFFLSMVHSRGKLECSI